MDKRTINVNISGADYKVTLWDPAGQEKYELLTNQYIRNLDGILLVFDTTEDSTYENVDKWIHQLTELWPDKPKIVAGNKWDLQNDRVINESEFKEMEKSHPGVKVIPTSAVGQGHNVTLAFFELITLVID